MICPNPSCQKHVPATDTYCAYCGRHLHRLGVRPLDALPPLWLRIFLPAVPLLILCLGLAFMAYYLR